MKRAPVSPDEATQRDQVRRLLDVLTALGVASGALLAGQAIAGNASYWLLVVVVWGFAVVLLLWARPLLVRDRVESAVTVMALAAMTIVLMGAVIRSSTALTVASMLVPVTAAVPYLEAKHLRRLMVLAWVATVSAAATTLIRAMSAAPGGDDGVGEFWVSALISGLLLFLLYQSSQNIKASNREFRRLFSLSSDLAETTEAGVLGDLVARHLTEATGMDDCVLYSLVPETSRLTPFGSYPAERAIQTEAQSFMKRPMLGRVIHERMHLVIDAADERSDSMERMRLDILGRRVMLLLPLFAHSDPVGVAELTSTRKHLIDERRIALARNLAFEAAMAIENGRLYQELHERSLHDPLTGLPNRGLFFDRVGHAIARLGRRPGPFLAVLFVDLDNFKLVNDTLGHARGDRLLALVAERLVMAVREVDTVARLGGDEFAILLEELTSEDEAVKVAQRAVNLLRAPFDLAGKPANVSASVGVAVRADDSTGTDTLLAEADAAMYEAKRAGKGRVVRSREAVLTA